MNRMAVAAIGVVLAAVSLVARHAPAADLSAGEIVAKNVAARGGLDAWRKVETMVWTGHIESAHAPAPRMPFVLEQKRPNKTRLQISALGQKSARVFDGEHGWKLRSSGGRPEVQPYDPQESKFAEAGHGIDGPLIDYAARGDSVTLVGVDEIRGRRAYHLDVHLAKGGHEEVWVDAGTYLDVRYDRFAAGPGGASRRVSANYGDYRTVDGLTIPFLIETGAESATPDKMQIETVTLNAPLDPSRFGNPSESRGGGRARGGAGSAALRSGAWSGTGWVQLGPADPHGAVQ